MPAFDAAKTNAKTFIDLDGQDVNVRPVWEEGEQRVVVELQINGREWGETESATIRLSPGIIPQFTDAILWAALFGELANVASGNPSVRGE
ncbi:hypothetical protein ABZ725_41795 [Streptomyces sp. NPDC006872]|uniref:hypothetical protein n=1 Tax=Streptomyces sp. NPDC006872 TaxID=3155720 RepID=UPI0033E20C5A